MVTHLEWSDTIGKRVRSGDWADQAISTVVKIEEELQAAGDDFGLAANRRENAAQLVDYFMEEAKVVYVIYKVWTAGFKDWLMTRASPKRIWRRGRSADQLMAYPDGTPLDPEPRWEALALRAGRLANGIRSYDLRCRRDRRARWRSRRLADAPRPACRPDGRDPGLCRQAVRGGPARDRYRAIMEPYLQERYMPFDVRVTPYEETLDRNLYISLEAMRGHLVGPGVVAISSSSRRTTDGSSASTPVAPEGASWRRPRGGHRLTVLAPYEFGVIEEPASLDLGRARRLPLLRPLQPCLLDHPRRALGPPGPDGRSAPVAWRGRPGDHSQVPMERLEVPRGDSGARVRADRPDQATTSGHPAGARSTGADSEHESEGRRAIVTGRRAGSVSRSPSSCCAAGVRVTASTSMIAAWNVREAGGEALVVDLAVLAERDRSSPRRARTRRLPGERGGDP